MIENFIPYEQAVTLKELGFNEECLASFFELKCPNEGIFVLTNEGSLKAPLYQQAFKWLRDNYNVYHKIERNFGINDGILRYVGIYYKGNLRGNSPKNTTPCKNTYEEAEFECLKALITLIKK